MPLFSGINTSQDMDAHLSLVFVQDSIRYYNAVAVEKRVFKNLQLFMQNKQPGDDLFDRLNVSTRYLNSSVSD